jgi:hypothetical protein
VNERAVEHLLEQEGKIDEEDFVAITVPLLLHGTIALARPLLDRNVKRAARRLLEPQSGNRAIERESHASSPESAENELSNIIPRLKNDELSLLRAFLT